MRDIHVRPAQRDDIPALITLLDIATYGFVEHFYQTLSKPGSDLSQVFRSRMEDPESALSLRKAKIAQVDGQIAGFVICEDLPDPVGLLSDDTPPMLRPLFELESRAPGTKLVNFVASFDDMRGLGIGSKLLKEAEERPGPNGMSLTVHDQNIGARKLYERRGYREIARRPIIKQGWTTPATEWILMTRT